ncbi:DUF4142 domain-containing protein [Streptomyces sp. BI20]|uniref:DUF4142 domain-containing protein n=1 Tax=Streptomyces sp. BI20 TaxID=3403460 RepID=UPI003C718669
MNRTRPIRARVLGTMAAAFLAAGPLLVSAPAWAANDADRAFVVEVHQGNLFEIQAGQDAAKRGGTDCVRQAGARIAADHRKLDADVTALARKIDVTLPTTPSDQARDTLTELRDTDGAGYDALWVSTQVTAHEDTLKAIDARVAANTDPAVTAAAKKARPVVAAHLAMLDNGACTPMNMPSAPAMQH